MVNGTARAVGATSCAVARALQTGNVQHYAVSMLLRRDGDPGVLRVAMTSEA